MNSGKELFRRAGEGENLSKKERRIAVQYAEVHRPRSINQLAERFGVTERTIYADLKAINKQYKQAANNSMILGEKLRTYTDVKQELIAGREATEKGTQEHMKYVKAIWNLTKDITDFLLDPEVQKIAEMEQGLEDKSEELEPKEGEEGEEVEGKEQFDQALEEESSTYKLTTGPEEGEK
ncbi:HTH domain-containing protein [Candidatus Bipolaricaulota bacterium]|nr:HTH domain-containing protein [Candidatus Bipolaricaulota bacterium]